MQARDVAVAIPANRLGTESVIPELQTNQALYMGGASAPPSSEATALTRTPSSLIRESLQEVGVPPGMCQMLSHDDSRVGMRIYLLDNSGSMSQFDGHMLHGQQFMACTRWDEVCAMAREQAAWNTALGSPCEFVLLNSMGRTQGVPVEGVDYVSFRDGRCDVRRLEELLQRNGPRGVTPLSDRIVEIRQRMAAKAQTLSKKGQLIHLTIATDGMPTSSQSGTSTSADTTRLGQELRRLVSELPVQLVIRLCTDDDQVVQFYNSLDEEFELPLDVLDDFSGEAAEISKCGNDWFVYTPLIHKIREAGTLCKLFDDIDERKLNAEEAKLMVQLLIQDDKARSELAAVQDKDGFMHIVHGAVAAQQPIYNHVTKRTEPIINVRKLGRILGTTPGCCFM